MQDKWLDLGLSWQLTRRGSHGAMAPVCRCDVLSSGSVPCGFLLSVSVPCFVLRNLSWFPSRVLFLLFSTLKALLLVLYRHWQVEQRQPVGSELLLVTSHSHAHPVPCIIACYPNNHLGRSSIVIPFSQRYQSPRSISWAKFREPQFSHKTRMFLSYSRVVDLEIYIFLTLGFCFSIDIWKK